MSITRKAFHHIRFAGMLLAEGRRRIPLLVLDGWHTATGEPRCPMLRASSVMAGESSSGGKWMETVRSLGIAAAAFSLPVFSVVGPIQAKSAGTGNTLLLRAVRAIRSQENAIRDIRIRASYRFWGRFRRASNSVAWMGPREPINRYVLAAVMDGLPHGKFAAAVKTEQILARPGKPDPFDIDSFLVAYNGRVGTKLIVRFGTAPKDLQVSNGGQIYGKMPGIRDAIDQATGWAWSIYGFTGNLPFGYHPRFSRFISPSQRKVRISAQQIMRAGKPFLQVTRIGSPLGKDVFLLDPRRKYSIIKCDHYGWTAKMGTGNHFKLVAGTRLLYSFRVKGFIGPVQGVFYPQMVRMVIFRPKPPRSRGHGNEENIAVTRVLSVRVNSPSVGPGAYVVRFHRGSVVRNMVTGRFVRVGGTPHQQLAQIQAAVEKARNNGPAKPPQK